MTRSVDQIIAEARADVETKWAALTVEDQTAKAAGTLVGRFYQQPVADGYSYYKIVKVTRRTAHLEHVNVFDGYRVAMIDQMGGKVPLKVVQANVQLRDAYDAIFAGPHPA